MLMGIYFMINHSSSFIQITYVLRNKKNTGHILVPIVIIANLNTFVKTRIPIIWKRNNTTPVSLDNWMKDFNMDCESTTLISAFRMVFFATFAIGNVILPPYADKYGRKNLYVVSLFVCLTSYFGFFHLFL